ncbi:hypothetical protein GQ53DRAFT_773245 [Thozetella sp. PMI_491]|nr:hypothetical protein GQ53DRAFT_773245 [Thozetella sp. PMI_491]
MSSLDPPASGHGYQQEHRGPPPQNTSQQLFSSLQAGYQQSYAGQHPPEAGKHAYIPQYQHQNVQYQEVRHPETQVKQQQVQPQPYQQSQYVQQQMKIEPQQYQQDQPLQVQQQAQAEPQQYQQAPAQYVQHQVQAEPQKYHQTRPLQVQQIQPLQVQQQMQAEPQQYQQAPIQYVQQQIQNPMSQHQSQYQVPMQYSQPQFAQQQIQPQVQIQHQHYVQQIQYQPSALPQTTSLAPPAYSPADVSTSLPVNHAYYYQSVAVASVPPPVPNHPAHGYADQAATFSPPPMLQEKPETKKSIGLQMLKNFGKEISSVSKQTYQQAKREFATSTPNTTSQAIPSGVQNEGTNTPSGTREGTQAAQGEPVPIPRKPVGQHIGEFGARALDMAKSEKGKKVLFSAASALDFVSTIADPSDSDGIALQMFNSVIQSEVKKSKAKQEQATREVEAQDATADKDKSERNGGIHPTQDNPLANMTPDQVAMILALASQIQSAQGRETAEIRPGVQIPDLSKLTVEDPPEALLNELFSGTETGSYAVPKDFTLEEKPPTTMPGLNHEKPAMMEVFTSMNTAYMNYAIEMNAMAGASTANLTAHATQTSDYASQVIANIPGNSCASNNNIPIANVEPFPVTDLVRAMGCAYKYKKTGNGWYEENDYVLRVDGTFAFNLGGAAFAQSYDHLASAYAYDQRKPTGYWKAEGTTTNGAFTFRHGNGVEEVREYCEDHQGHFHVGGLRWFRV